MTPFQFLQPSDLDVTMDMPPELLRLIDQGIVHLTPWHIIPRDLACKRMATMRLRYAAKYVPIAYRQDNDDIACIEPARPGHVIIVHDFASEGTQERALFTSTWDWFRKAVEDMISFE
jgi:hypothetical protein